MQRIEKINFNKQTIIALLFFCIFSHGCKKEYTIEDPTVYKWERKLFFPNWGWDTRDEMIRVDYLHLTGQQVKKQKDSIKNVSRNTMYYQFRKFK